MSSQEIVAQIVNPTKRIKRSRQQFEEEHATAIMNENSVLKQEVSKSKQQVLELTKFVQQLQQQIVDISKSVEQNKQQIERQHTKTDEPKLDLNYEPKSEINESKEEEKMDRKFKDAFEEIREECNINMVFQKKKYQN